MPVLEKWQKLVRLLIHGEVTHKEIDIFDEKVLLIRTLFCCKELPELKITLEHITTKETTEYVDEGNENLLLQLPHHLL